MGAEEGMSYGDLAEHGRWTVQDHLRTAIQGIEKQMGKGAAEKYPQIVAAMVQASSTEFLASMMSHRIAPKLESLALAAYAIRDTLSE